METTSRTSPRQAERASTPTTFWRRLRYRLAQRFAALGTRLLGRDGRIRALPPPLNAWTNRRDFPTFAGESFRDRWHKRGVAKQRPDGADGSAK